MTCNLSYVITVTGISLALMQTNALAEIYKWTDASGKVHYSQTPPPDYQKKAETIGKRIRQASSQGSGGAAIPEPVEKTAEKPKQIIEDPDMQAAKAEGEKRREEIVAFCNKNRDALRQILANPLIKIRENNKERMLSAKERNDKIQELNDSHKENCSADALGTHS